MPTEMPKCETCRHWGEDGARILGAEWQVCSLAHTDDFGRPKNIDTAVFAVGFSPSGQEQWGELRTRSDFGCIAHQPKEG